MSSIGERIQELRKHRGLTQQELAERLNYSDSSPISKFETSVNEPTIDAIIKLADVLHTSVDYLLGRTNSAEYKSGLGKDILEGEVIRNEYMLTNDKLILTLKPDGIQFNTACVMKWSDIEHIQLIIHKRKKQLIIKKSSIYERDSRKWCNKREGKSIPRKLTGREFAKRIYEMMAWSLGRFYKVVGNVVFEQTVFNEEFIIFELENYIGFPLKEKTRLKAGVANEDLSAEELKELTKIESEMSKEEAERKLAKEKGCEPKPRRSFAIYPDKWGQYTFGVLLEKHKNYSELNFDIEGLVYE